MRWLRTFAAWPSSSLYAESPVFRPFSVRFPPVFHPSSSSLRFFRLGAVGAR